MVCPFLSVMSESSGASLTMLIMPYVVPVALLP